MRKLFFILAILSIVLTAASPVNPARLTIVNKASKKVEVKLVAADDSGAYNFLVDKGSKDFPSETVFVIEKGQYSMSVHYVEIYDPVYGYTCEDVESTLVAKRNIRVVILECNQTPPNSGEGSLMKYGVKTIR